MAAVKKKAKPAAKKAVAKKPAAKKAAAKKPAAKKAAVQVRAAPAPSAPTSMRPGIWPFPMAGISKPN